MADKGLSFSLGSGPKRGAPGRLSFGLRAAPRAAKPAAVFSAADSSDDEADGASAPGAAQDAKRQRTGPTPGPACEGFTALDVLSSLQSTQFCCCVLKGCTQGAHRLRKTQSMLQASGGTHAWPAPG